MGIFLNKASRVFSRLNAKGGGGGGSSGKIDYPDYMETMHSTWLTEMDTIINTIQGEAPYALASAYDPDTAINSMISAITVFNNIDVVSSLSDLGGSTEIDIETQVEANSDIITNDINTNVLPQYKSAMRDLNAVMSSAFVLGESYILSEKTRQLTKLQADLEIGNAQIRLENDKIKLQAYQQEIEFYRVLTHYTIEANRMKIVAKNEEVATNIEYDVKDAMWDISTYREGANLLASISGAAVQGEAEGPSKAQSALGGALAGASVGAIAGPYGAAAGAAVGLIGGLLSS